MHLDSALVLVNSTLATLRNMRSDAKFDSLYLDSQNRAVTLGISICSDVQKEQNRPVRSKQLSKTLGNSVVLTSVGQRSGHNSEEAGTSIDL